MIRLKHLIVEGMYDKLTGEINKDIFKTIKKATKGSGTEENPKKYKGYIVRKDPAPTTKMSDMFNAERATLYVGDYSDEVSGVDVEVEMKLAISDEGVEEGK
jgi:hypothetical protein